MPSEDVSRAKSCCLQLIKFRLRSEHEIREKLKDKDFSLKVIEEAVVFLKKSGLLDDRLFARLWVSSRLNKPYGARRLRFELKKKGIAPSLIEEALEPFKDESASKKILEEFVERKIKKLKGLPPEKAKARLYSLLMRRGFSQGDILDTIHKKFKSSFTTLS